MVTRERKATCCAAFMAQRMKECCSYSRAMNKQVGGNGGGEIGYMEDPPTIEDRGARGIL